MRTMALLVRIILLGLLSLPAFGADKYPLRQGLHEWPAFGGKLYLVVGTYQDSVAFRRTYHFFVKEASDDAWNQVTVLSKKGSSQPTWESAVGADVTLADGTIVARRDGTYFVVASKQVKGSYHDKGTIEVTWYKLTQAGDDQPDDPAYQFKPVFTRPYPHSAQTVEDILNKEANLQPKK